MAQPLTASRSRTFALVTAVGLAAALPTLMVAAQRGGATAGRRPQGPCDIYAAAGDPCVAAHSTTRALYAVYSGPLYQVLRQSDGKTLDIGVVAAGADGGGYADASAQDTFCANTYCWITKIYDQSAKHNDLTQAPRGGFSGPAMGGFNNLPLADMAPVTVMGHKVYGVFIEPGMGLRKDDPAGTAVDDQAEGQYWVINGLHYNAGCCFDYGNAETDSRDDGNGTMETTYFGNSTGWFHGNPPGPWVMTDQENNLVGCVTSDRSKLCTDIPSVTWRFVTAMAKGEPHHWTSLGGDAQQGALKVMFDGGRVDQSYDPMRKQGAILLGNGGDNSNGSQGTFYEGAMTAAGTFPTDATDQLIQANVVAAQYGVTRVNIGPAAGAATPAAGAFATSSPMTFAPGASRDVAFSFTNVSTTVATNVELSVAVPTGWKTAIGTASPAPTSLRAPGGGPITLQPGNTFGGAVTVTSGPTSFNGDIVVTARWTDGSSAKHAETAVEKVRNVSPVRINEFQIGAGAPANPTNAFIELFNAGSAAVDVSNWTVTAHAIQLPVFSNIKVPMGTKITPGGFFLLALANSGLVTAAHKGDTVVFARSTVGMTVGDAVAVDTGAAAETRKIASLGGAATASTTLWQPLPDGPIMTIPVGSTSVPVTNITGFAVGEKIAIGYGATFPVVGLAVEKYEVATVTAVGKAGTQGRLSSAAPAGTSLLKIGRVEDISVGDKIRLDIASVGHGVETVTVTAVGTAGPNGTGVSIAEKLKFDHAANMPFSDRGTGITFTPATAVAHASNEPVQALGAGITLDAPLTRDHAIDAVLRDASVTSAGYQGPKAPDAWFGGPAFSTNAGSIVLRDAAGLIVDSLNYGGLVDPWVAKGYQGASGATANGCRAPLPGTGLRAGGAGGAPNTGVNRSAGRFPDGADTDSNCTDFLTQVTTTMPIGAAAGATNLKVVNLTDFVAGQTVVVGAGAEAEMVTIASVGTAGATVTTAESATGATVLNVANALNGAGFTIGQSVTVGVGASAETVTLAPNVAGRGGPQGATLTLASPLTSAHAAGEVVAGTGLTLRAPLAHAHGAGTPVATSAPTPGAPNTYIRR
jgi:hypothetical protein